MGYIEELQIALIEQNEPKEDIAAAYKYAENLISLDMPVIFNREHFSLLVGCEKEEIYKIVSSLESHYYHQITKQVGIKSSVDSDGKMLPDTILTLKDLRNAVAHNNTIFDTRFKTSGINSRIAKYIESETGIKQITFNTIADYVILISFLLKLLKCPKSEIVAFVKDFENIIEVFRKSVSISIYSAVVYTDTRNKLTLLKKLL